MEKDKVFGVGGSFTQPADKEFKVENQMTFETLKKTMEELQLQQIRMNEAIIKSFLIPNMTQFEYLFYKVFGMKITVKVFRVEVVRDFSGGLAGINKRGKKYTYGVYQHLLNLKYTGIPSGESNFQRKYTPADEILKPNEDITPINSTKL